MYNNKSNFFALKDKAIGLHINEIDQIDESELIEFRLSLFRQLKQSMDEVSKRSAEAAAAVTKPKTHNDHEDDEEEEKQNDEEEREFRSFMECIYAPNLEIDPSLLDTSLINTVNRLQKIKFADNLTTNAQTNSKLEINVHIVETEQPEVTYHLSVDPDTATPTQIIMDIIKAKLSALKQSDSQIDEIVNRLLRIFCWA